MEQFSNQFTPCTDKDHFRSMVRNLITTKSGAIIAAKPDDKKYLSHLEFCHVCDHVGELFRLQFGSMRKEVEGTLAMCKSITAPMGEKIVLLKQAVIALGGAAGLGAIITGIGLALGWGQGVIATVVAFFTGTSIAGPVAWIVGGTTLLVIAGYFAFGNDEAKASERAIEALKSSLDEVINQIWQ